MSSSNNAVNTFKTKMLNLKSEIDDLQSKISEKDLLLKEEQNKKLAVSF